METGRNAKELQKKKFIRTPVLRAKVPLRADSSTVNDDAENDKAYEPSHFDSTEKELNYETSANI
jgi:hypothetical protein